MDTSLSTDSRLRVALRPAWRGPNPYTALLADALVKSGLSVAELRYNFSSILQKADVLVFHWPDEFFYQPSLLVTYRSLRSLLALCVAKFVQRKKIVWVAHNLQPHRPAERQSRLHLSGFFALLDGIIYLSETSRALVGTTYPQLAECPSIVIAHGDYRPIEHCAPRAPEVPIDRPVHLIFIGQVRRYKGPDVLARVVANLPADEVELTIAGACKEADLEAELAQTASGAANIRLSFGYLENDQMEALIDAADVVVLPYRAILNSGSALLALSRFRPVIAPRLGSLIELQREVGEEWLYLYEGELTGEALDGALAWARRPRLTTKPDLSRQDWSKIAHGLASFFQKL